jgi:hypothetical protein
MKLCIWVNQTFSWTELRRVTMESVTKFGLFLYEPCGGLKSSQFNRKRNVGNGQNSVNR